MTLTDRPRQALSVPYAIERSDRIPSKRYYDPDFYAMECELLWPHVWQMACRLAEIPNPGDYVEYEILDKSIIVVRVDQTTVRAISQRVPPPWRGARQGSRELSVWIHLPLPWLVLWAQRGQHLHLPAR